MATARRSTSPPGLDPCSRDPRDPNLSRDAARLPARLEKARPQTEEAAV